MAMVDYETTLSWDKALQSTATTAYSTNEFYFGTGKDAFQATLATPYIGRGTPVYLNFVMTVAGATGDGGTLTMNVVHGAATAPTTVLMTLFTTVAAADLVAGYKVSVALPQYPDVLAYLRLQEVTGTGGFTAGSYSAWLSNEPLADV